jgi:hypothetical protein
LAKDIRCGALRHIGAELAGDGHLARLARVLILLMTSTLRHELPAIVFERSNELTELHLAIVPRLSAGPCPEESDQRERRTADDQLAARVIPLRPVSEVVT